MDLQHEKEKALFNTALYIDYENVHKNLLRNNQNAIRDGFFEKIRQWCKSENRRLVKVVVYCNFDIEDLYSSYHQSLLQDFGVETVHTSNQGKNFADLKLAIDVLTDMHNNNNIDEFIIMSNDKDMTPLLNSIRYNKRKVSIITTGETYNKAICAFADEQIKYEDIISVDYENLLIYQIQEGIYRNIEAYFEKNWTDYKETGKDFKHIKLENYCKNQVRYSKIMEYEVFNCLYELGRSIKNEERILFYNYYDKYKNVYVGIAPNIKRDEMIRDKIITENDIFEYNIEKVKEVFQKYIKESN